VKGFTSWFTSLKERASLSYVYTRQTTSIATASSYHTFIRRVDRPTSQETDKPYTYEIMTSLKSAIRSKSSLVTTIFTTPALDSVKQGTTSLTVYPVKTDVLSSNDKKLTNSAHSVTNIVKVPSDNYDALKTKGSRSKDKQPDAVSHVNSEKMTQMIYSIITESELTESDIVKVSSDNYDALNTKASRSKDKQPEAVSHVNSDKMRQMIYSIVTESELTESGSTFIYNSNNVSKDYLNQSSRLWRW
jgi:hypothetical protein